MHDKKIQENPSFPFLALRAARLNSRQINASCICAGRQGIEPQLKASKASVLPLDDLPKYTKQTHLYYTFLNYLPPSPFMIAIKASSSGSDGMYAPVVRSYAVNNSSNVCDDNEPLF